MRYYSDQPLREALKDKNFWAGSLARARSLYFKHHQKIPIKIAKLLQHSLFMSFKALKDSERKIALPFSMILFDLNEAKMLFRVTEVLRVLPKKRLVVMRVPATRACNS